VEGGLIACCGERPGGSQLTGLQMRAHLTICPKRPASLGALGPVREEPKSQARPRAPNRPYPYPSEYLGD
jgi:hypothetical protein